ncbi:MAG: hypothetical protein J0L70_27160 [Leptolyngbya sp. UWPOB_LEPTO1]|uniref:AAA family ATPase n=1 Tax=Leptolyngbya sp. UWPOB_LEPTO1 TaxID=2815653 RepID=UPI001AC633C0|nr:AAA family ATPase [Leptolyngbya sp. UWPOB_LEPTO1]MBN8564217.1 hypothetical protein [Leptolyngbya sp. UWPOB_LEPTO1]
MGLKASTQGKEAIAKAIKAQEFRLNGKNCPLQAVKESFGEELSETTWERFIYAKAPIREKNFNALCKILQLDPKNIAMRPEAHCFDSAPMQFRFYGREPELQALEHWIKRDRCRLILICGLDGIGKTWLAAKLTDKVHDRFDRSFSQDFSYAQPIREIIANLLRRVDSDFASGIDLHESLLNLRMRLIKALTDQRILITLNESWDDRDRLQDSYHQMQGWLLELSEKAHQSCVVMTTRIELDMPIIEKKVQSLKLGGLCESAIVQLLNDKGITCNLDSARRLGERYGGNPSALNLAVSLIIKHYGGDCEGFLSRTIMIPPSLEEIYRQHWDHLSETHKALLKQLAACQEALLKEELDVKLSAEVPASEIDLAVFDLERRSLLELVQEGSRSAYTLQPVLQRLIQRKKLV